MPCKCYHADKNFLGKIGVCWGTKECEACSCGGDESKCDFYEDKRKKATPKTTNADRIRAMDYDALALLLSDIADGYLAPVDEEICNDCKEVSCTPCWHLWLRKEVT